MWSMMFSSAGQVDVPNGAVGVVEHVQGQRNVCEDALEMPAEMATRQLEAARVQKQVRAWFASFRSASAVVAAPNAFSDLLVHGFLFS